GCQGQVGDVHALLGVERTAEGADAAAVAVPGVSPDRPSAVTQRLAAGLEQLAVGAHDLGADGADPDHLLDLVENRSQLVGIQSPLAKQPLGRPEAGAGADDG